MISEYSNFGKMDASQLEQKKPKVKQTRSVEVLKRSSKGFKIAAERVQLINQLEKVKKTSIKLKPVQPKMKKKINKKAVFNFIQSLVSLFSFLSLK